MAPLPLSDLSSMAIYNTAKPDPKLLAHAIIGARFTSIHALMIWVMIFFPLMMFLAYRTSIKEWVFENHAKAKRTEHTFMQETSSEKSLHPTCIDLETALRSINPDDADLCWEVNEDDIRINDSPDQVFNEKVLETCLLQAEEESEQKRKEEERGKEEALEEQQGQSNTRKDTKLPPSGLTYQPLTADEMTAASEGLDPILYTGAEKSQVYYNAHQKRKHQPKEPGASSRTPFGNKRAKAADGKHVKKADGANQTYGNEKTDAEGKSFFRL
ncbi:hypothetical protein EV426DRAFT_571743 [Tirmania nivea]|nr:hypothetical protein EV426DRAFT_571743 [Tirmania nivea]